MSEILREIFLFPRDEEEKENGQVVSSLIKRLKEQDCTCGNYSLTITVYGRKMELIRLTDPQFSALRTHTLTIKESDDSPRDIYFYRLAIEEVYAVLRSRFGVSCQVFDDEKGSFSFPFLLRFPEEPENLGYILHVYDRMWALKYVIGKIVEPDDKRDKWTRIPPSPDFKQEEITKIMDSFVAFCELAFPMVSKHYEEEFVHRMSRCGIYGYRDGKFFAISSEGEESWSSFLKKHLP